MDELLQVRQERRDTKAASHHQHALVPVHGQGHSVRPAEHNNKDDGITPLGVVQQLAGEASPWFYQQVERVLCRGSPRNDRERVGLEEGPEADGWDPQVNVSACLSLHRSCEVELHLDRALVVADGRTGEMVREDSVSNDDDRALQEKHRRGYAYANDEIVAEEGFIREDVSPDCIKGGQSKGLV